MSLINVHLAAITSFHDQVDGIALFTHPTTKHFIMGIQNVYPNVCTSTIPWDLNLVLQGSKPPFDPLVMCSFMYLSMKVSFLVAITSACRIGEIGALMAYPPYTVFFKDKVSLRPPPKFIPKIASSFHIN